jgi:hypothetical protein
MYTHTFLQKQSIVITAMRTSKLILKSSDDGGLVLLTFWTLSLVWYSKTEHNLPWIVWSSDKDYLFVMAPAE